MYAPGEVKLLLVQVRVFISISSRYCTITSIINSFIGALYSNTVLIEDSEYNSMPCTGSCTLLPYEYRYSTINIIIIVLVKTKQKQVRYTGHEWFYQKGHRPIGSRLLRMNIGYYYNREYPQLQSLLVGSKYRTCNILLTLQYTCSCTIILLQLF